MEMESNNSESDSDFNPLADLEDDNDHDIVNEPKPASCNPQRKIVSRRSKLWDYFDRDPSQRGVAICRFCHVRLSCRTTITNLGKHLTHKHTAEMAGNVLPEPVTLISPSPKESEERESSESKEGEKAEEPMQEGCEEKSSRKYRSKSIAWKYFTILCKARKRARCKICSESFSYATTVSNLVKHLHRKHRDVHLADSELLPTSISPIWAYFRCLDEVMRIASCLICTKRIIYSDGCEELRRHLCKKHPNVDLDENTAGKTFMVTDSGELYEIDVNKTEPVATVSDTEENETYSNADYLDDAFEEPETKVKPTPKRTRQLTAQPVPKTIKLIEKPEDPIDIFGKYIVSLLKQLPKKTSSKLQYQIVKQICEAQSEDTVNYDDIVSSNSEKVTAINNSE